MNKFVVIGTVRAATTYIAELWTKIGVQCSHEVIFDKWGRDFNGYKGWTMPHIIGVSSFSAMPFVDRIEEPHVVFHQRRNKEKVVSSIMHYGWLSEFPSGTWDFNNFMNYHCHGELVKVKDYKQRIETLYDIWNAKCAEVADISYYIEDLTPELMLHMCKKIGYDCDIRVIEEAMESVSKTTNGRC